MSILPFIRSDLYEERDTGDAGIAIFAKQHIEPGTCLFHETPLLLVREDQTPHDLLRMLDNSSKQKRIEFWDLAATHCDERPGNSEILADALNTMRMTFDGPEDDFEEQSEHLIKAWDTYKTNRFNVPTPKEDLSGVFAKASRLNHSCRPNVFHKVDGTTQRLSIHTIKAIEAGEQIMTSYIDICQPTKERQDFLEMIWGFVCQCSLCSSSDVSSDDRRATLYQHMQEIRERKTTDHTTKDGVVDTKAMARIHQTLELMRLEGINESDTTGIVYDHAAMLCERLHQWKEMKHWTLKSQTVHELCLGSNSQEYLSATEMLRTADMRLGDIT